MRNVISQVIEHADGYCSVAEPGESWRMSFFITRVVLHEVPHDLSRDVYKSLHERMEAEGFKVTIGSGTNTQDLPPAEYAIEGDLSTEDVMAKAKRAAGLLQTDFGVIVTPGCPLTFGLKNDVFINRIAEQLVKHLIKTDPELLRQITEGTHGNG